MALVMKNEFVEEYLTTKMAAKDGVTTTVAVDGVTHMDIITYPAQDVCADGAILAMIKKPFIDFAAACGPKGAMTAAMITAKYGEQIPAAMVETLVSDFAVGYGNYVIIPDGMTLAITALPIKSIFDLLLPENPTPDPTAVD